MTTPAWRTLAAASALTLLLGTVAAPVPAGATTETYLFRDTLAPIEGAGNVLVAVSNDTGAILTSGGSFVNGAFVDETISASACATTPTVRAWSFPNEGGLRYDNAGPQLVTGSYSISMLLRYNPMDAGYARLIDFSNSTLDTGIYKYADGVRFYPVSSTLASGAFVQDQDVFVTVTRDAGTKLVTLYINGTLADSTTDGTDLYAPSATVVYLLMDNTTGSANITETDPGVLAYLQIRDTPMTADEVTASLATICQTVTCGDGIISGTEQCDDGNTTAGDGCSPTCTVEACFHCSGTPSTCSATGGTGCPDVCAAAPAGTFASVLCRLDALLARIQGESRLSSFQRGLAQQIQNAKARVLAAQSAAPGKKQRKKLQQAAKFVSAYVHRLGSLTARKKLDATLRTDFKDDGTPILKDLKTLRAS